MAFVGTTFAIPSVRHAPTRAIPRRAYTFSHKFSSAFCGMPLRRMHAVSSTVRSRTGPVMQYGGSPSFPERYLSILPYLMPLLDAVTYGRFIFRKAPEVASIVLTPLAPLLTIYRGVPFVAFGVFLALYLLVVRNSNVSRYIRWNTQQAILLDILLIFPQLFSNLSGQVPLGVVEALSNSVFYGMVAAVGYAVVSNIKGEIPNQIPGVSSSVDQMLGPY
mmetsp:Transcript_31639/g.77508  ORF Transcript_31639/g.77508 Transcript_31639/m.77508 type:complete len:219 (+) Transcript_31639:288-944(+)